MVIAMMMPTMLNVFLMEEIAVDHVSIRTIAPIALALAMSMRIECPMPLLEMVIAMTK